jgi:hypothetical protein
MAGSYRRRHISPNLTPFNSQTVGRSPTLELFKLWGKSPMEAAMIRSRLSTKVVLLVAGVGLSVVALAGSQPAAAQAYTCPVGSTYDPTYGCTVDDFGYYGYGYPYSAYRLHYGRHREFGHGFDPASGSVRVIGHGFYHGFGHGMGGGDHGIGFAHAGGFGHGGGGHR